MSALQKVVKLAQGSAPDFIDVNFPVEPDLDGQLDLEQATDSSFHFSDRANQELDSLPAVYREQIGQHLDDASDHLADGDLRGAATCLVQACSIAHLQSRHHLAREIHTYSRAVALGGNATPDTGDDGDPGSPADMKSEGKTISPQNDNPTQQSTFNGRIAASAPALDKVLAFAMPMGISSHLGAGHPQNLRMHLMQEHGGMPAHHSEGLEDAHQHLHALGTANHVHPEMEHTGISAGRRVI